MRYLPQQAAVDLRPLSADSPCRQGAGLESALMRMQKIVCLVTWGTETNADGPRAGGVHVAVLGPIR